MTRSKNFHHVHSPAYSYVSQKYKSHVHYGVKNTQYNQVVVPLWDGIISPPMSTRVHAHLPCPSVCHPNGMLSLIALFYPTNKGDMNNLPTTYEMAHLIGPSSTGPCLPHYLFLDPYGYLNSNYGHYLSFSYLVYIIIIFLIFQVYQLSSRYLI